MKNPSAHRKLLVPLLVAVAAIAAGCNDAPERTSLNVSPPPPAPTTPAANDTTVDKLAEATNDAAITGKVKAAMIAEPGLSALAIDVDTRDRVVTLSGTVDTPVAKEKAIQVAGSIDGVSSVVDRLTLKM